MLLKYMILRNQILAYAFLGVFSAAYAQPFYFGVDLSYVNEMEDCGAEYKVNNNPTDPFQIFKERGANLVRLRLWHTPSWYDNLNQGNRYSDFADVRQSIIRAKSQGMNVLLDFHLSDNWADPSHQVVPAAWAPIVNNLAVLQDSLYNYIYVTLNKLAAEDLLPEIVQIGNETNRGILVAQAVNDAGWSLDWDRNSALFNTAISAVRDIETIYKENIKITIHIAGPTDASWYFDQFQLHDVVDFDIIGLSYYWQWHQDLFDVVGDAISDYSEFYPDKEVMILETAYPWTTANADGANNILSFGYPGYTPFSQANQKEWLIDLTQEVIDHGGLGVVYWEPAWVSTTCFTQFAQGSSWDNATFFDSNDNLLVNGGIEWMSYIYEFPTATNEPAGLINKLEIIQSGDRIIIVRNDKMLINGSLAFKIFTIDGKIISNQSLHPIWEDSKLLISLPALITGLYLVTVAVDNQILAMKILIQR